MSRGLVPAAVAALLAAGGAGAAEPVFALSIAPQGEAAYLARCTLTDAAGEAVAVELTGSAPLRREFAGAALRCEVEQTAGAGGLEVEVTSPTGNRSRSKTGGSGSRIVIAVR